MIRVDLVAPGLANNRSSSQTRKGKDFKVTSSKVTSDATEETNPRDRVTPFPAIMSSPSLVSTTHSETRYLPFLGEVVVVRLSEPLRGPGSRLTNVQSLPSGATHHNYHQAIVLTIQFLERGLIDLVVLPAPAYSSIDADNNLSSTPWLLQQPCDVQEKHIPIPYEQTDDTPVYPSFPTPPSFGAPLNIGGWKNRKPSWVLTVPQKITIKYATKVRTLS